MLIIFIVSFIVFGVILLRFVIYKYCYFYVFCFILFSYLFVFGVLYIFLKFIVILFNFNLF